MLVDHDVTVTIADDGTGIPATTTRSGLHNLTQRAEHAGGRLTLTAPRTGGTTLTWTAPIHGPHITAPSDPGEAVTGSPRAARAVGALSS